MGTAVGYSIPADLPKGLNPKRFRAVTWIARVDDAPLTKADVELLERVCPVEAAHAPITKRKVSKKRAAARSARLK